MEIPGRPASEDVEYTVKIEADVPGLWVPVVRDPNEIPQAIGVITGDDRTDAQTLLSVWGLDDRGSDPTP